MGPDHSQLEIYEESKHGVMFHAQEQLLNLDAPPKTLTTRDMFVPTCATCHMSGLNGQKVTHDPSERLSYYLADAITKPRPNYDRAQAEMKEICAQCHTQPLVDRVYAEAEKVVATTNEKVQAATDIMTALRKDGVLDRRAVHAADRLRLLRPLALLRPDVQARRVHGRRRLRPVARQLPDARAHRGAPAQAEELRRRMAEPRRAAGVTITSSGSRRSSLVNFAGLIARHLSGALGEPVPPRGRVHPAYFLARRAAVLLAASCRFGAASAGGVARRRAPGRLAGASRSAWPAWSCISTAASSTSARSRA